MAFESLYVAWRKDLLARFDPTTPSKRLDAMFEQSLDMELARKILVAPIPDAWYMRTKLEVITHYIFSRGNDLDPMERLVATGLGALAADMLHFWG